jgi:hypothetical protein
MHSDLPPVSAVEDPERLAELAAASLLDTPPEVAFDRFTKLATRLLGCPVSMVSLVDKDRQFFKSHVGLPEPWATERETPLSHSFCQHVVNSGRPLIVADARDSEFLRHNEAIRDLGVIAYLGMPLTTASGNTLGSLCAIDGQPREWSEEAIETLKDLGTLVMKEIELRNLAKHYQSSWTALRDVEMQRDEFVQMLVHDLRNPMTSMLMALDLLNMSELPKRQKDWIDGAQKSGESMLKMIGDILDVAKAEAGQLQLDLSEADPSEIVAVVYEQLAPSAAAAGVSLVTSMAPQLPPVRVDAEKLRRVLINLVANAIQHSARGQVTTCASMNDAGDALVLVVQDTGCGIPPELWGRIFEKFGTAEARKKGRVSTGLGLAFCKKVVEAHGGEITVSSQVGAGSSFTLTISTRL